MKFLNISLLINHDARFYRSSIKAAADLFLSVKFYSEASFLGALFLNYAFNLTSCTVIYKVKRL